MPSVRERRIIDDRGADAVIEAASAYASEHGHRVVMLVVDARTHDNAPEIAVESSERRSAVRARFFSRSR